MARSMVRQSVPAAGQQVQQAGFSPDGKSGVTPAQFCPPWRLNCPPNLHAAGLPGMPGRMPGPGCPAMRRRQSVRPWAGPPGAVAAVGALTGGPSPVSRPSEPRCASPAPTECASPGSRRRPTAGPASAPQYLETPGRYNFLQAAIYRLKLSDIPNRPGVELYPTLEVVPGNAKTATFLAHSAVPVTFTEEDFNQVAAGNYLVKVIYLPDPQFQDLAATGTDEVISSRLEPGVDPIAEAHRRGSILLVVRLGNIDLEAPNTPAMDAPSPYAAAAADAAPAGRRRAPRSDDRRPACRRAAALPPGRLPPESAAESAARHWTAADAAARRG